MVDSSQDASPSDNEGKPADGTGSPENTTNGETTASKDNKPRRPRVFGRFGWFATLVPFVMFLGGISIGGYIENVRDLAQLKEQRLPVLAKIDSVERYYEALEKDGKKAEADRSRKLLNWEHFIDVLMDEDHQETPESSREAFAEVLGSAGEVDGPIFVELREEVEKYLRYWERYDALKRGEEPPVVPPRDLADDLELDGQAGENETDDVDDPTAEIIYVRWYSTYYPIVLACTAVLMVLAMPWYFKTPFNFSWLAVAVGVLGIVAWLGLWWLDDRFFHLGDMYPATRAAFNPFEELKHDPTWMYQFLAIRFAGLVIVVPIIEEFFLRGWLMRYIDDPDWDEVPLGTAGRWAIIGVAIYGVLTHPNEPLAAIVWFSMVTWLYLRTKSIWNCVIAHAITNLLLGIFVIKTGTWSLW